MIIRRYLNSQVLATTLAVAGLLTVILMSGRVIQFFEKAANGKIAVNLLTAVLWYRLPGFLELIVPLGLFIALLLALGRMYLDNEMAILAAAGIGQTRLLQWLLPSALLITTITAVLSFWWTPAGNTASARLYAEQASRSTFDLIQPGRFQRVGERMLYANLSQDKSVLRDVLILETRPGDDKRSAHQVIVRADEGHRVDDPLLGPQVVELVRGQRWEGRPGEAGYQVVDFDSYRLRLKQDAPVADTPGDYPAMATSDLLGKVEADSQARAEWGWRWSLVAMVPVVTLLALPLARVNPRQGRYLKLLPAIVLYLSYVVLIVAVRNGVEKDDFGSGIFWSVHGLYLILALVLLHGRPRRRAAT